MNSDGSAPPPPLPSSCSGICEVMSSSLNEDIKEMEADVEEEDDEDDDDDDNGDRLINDFMCDILEDENDNCEFDNDGRLNQVAESVHHILANRIQQNSESDDGT